MVYIYETPVDNLMTFLILKSSLNVSNPYKIADFQLWTLTCSYFLIRENSVSKLVNYIKYFVYCIVIEQRSFLKL